MIKDHLSGQELPLGVFPLGDRILKQKRGHRPRKKALGVWVGRLFFGTCSKFSRKYLGRKLA